MKTILILGGGIGGIVSANELRKKIKQDYRIIIIEKNPVHSFAPSFIWLLNGDRKAASIKTDLKILLKKGIELIISEVKKINIEKKIVSAGNNNYYYDYLIIALGTELNPDLLQGLSPNANTFYTFDGSIKLHDELKNFKGGNISVVICSLPYKCPGAPHEGTLLISDFFRKKGILDLVSINFFTPEPQPMPVAGPVLGTKVEELLKSKGINFNPLHKLIRIDNEKNDLIFENKESVHYDLLVVIPPHRSPEVIRNSGLANDSGWIPVNLNTLETKYENVYAIGDNTTISIPGRWKNDVPMMLPKAGVFAHNQAETVAKRIADRINGKEPSDLFTGHGYCMIESGNSEAGFAFGNFYGEPHPMVEIKDVKKIWHLGKVLFEKWWLSPLGFKRTFYELLLKLSVKILRIPIKM